MNAVPSSAAGILWRMAWTLKTGPQRIADGPDDSRWLYTLESEGGVVRRLLLRIAGTAMSMGVDHLPENVAELRETEGRAIIGRFLAWPEPPREVVGCSEWINLRFDSGVTVRL